MQSKQIEELLVSEDALQNKLSEVETLLKAKQEEIEMKSGYLGYNELLDKNLELENQLQAVMADKEVESLKQQRDSERKDKRRYRDKYDLQKKEIIDLKSSNDEKSKQIKTQKVQIEQLN